MLPIAPLSKIIEIIQIIINRKFAYLAKLRKNKLQLFPFFHMGVKIADHLFHMNKICFLKLRITQQIIQILLTCGRIGIVHLLKHLIHIQIAPGNFINRKFSGMFIRITTDMRKPLRSVFPFQLLTIIRMQTLSEPFLFLTVIV